MADNDCCEDREQMEVVEERATPSGKLVVLQCGDCGRKHYVSQADAVTFGVEGADL